jgi:DNA mismatch repair ATPase MutS
MFLDSATLQDLEIVPMPRVRGTTLWSLVDRTRTRIGREVLRERLLAPPHAAAEILALQDAHRVLAAEASAYRLVLDNADPDRVDR